MLTSSIIDEISQKRHGREHTTKEIMSYGAFEALLERGVSHFQKIDLPLNWVYVASGKS